MIRIPLDLEIRPITNAQTRTAGGRAAAAERAKEQRLAAEFALRDAVVRDGFSNPHATRMDLELVLKARARAVGKDERRVRHRWGKPGSLRCPVRVHLLRIAPGKIDGHDGLAPALKAVADGVADALGCDDGAEDWIDWRYAQEHRGKGVWSVEVEVTEWVREDTASVATATRTR